MSDPSTANALRLLEAADAFRAGLTGEFSAVHGISVNEFLLMLHLERTPSHRLPRVDLARRMHVSASTITRMTAPMEKIGLVARDADARDQRIVHVLLTEAGQMRLGEAMATFAKRAGYLFNDRFPEAEFAQVAAVLRRIAPQAAGE